MNVHVKFLQSMFRNRESLDVNYIRREAKACGFTMAQMKYARDTLGYRSVHEYDDFGNDRYVWYKTYDLGFSG